MTVAGLFLTSRPNLPGFLEALGAREEEAAKGSPEAHEAWPAEDRPEASAVPSFSGPMRSRGQAGRGTDGFSCSGYRDAVTERRHLRHDPAGALRGWTWVGVPLGIFAVSRVFSTWFILMGADRQASTAVETSQVWFPVDEGPGYAGLLANWDAGWYRTIAENGYPRVLPLVAGQVTQSEWAFLPGYPMVVRIVMLATGWAFGVAATVVSLTCASLAMVLLYALVARVSGRAWAALAVGAVCLYPTSPILQLPYSESLALLLVVSALAALHARRYGWVLVLAVGLALTRQIVLALGLVVVLHALRRWRAREIDPFPARDRAALTILAGSCVVLTGLWPAIAGLVTGVPDAYLSTQSSWSVNEAGLGLSHSLLLSSFPGGGLGTLLSVALIIYVVLAFARPESRGLGLDLRAWALVYPLYLLAAVRPSPSVLRYMMLTVGALPPLPFLRPLIPSNRRYNAGLLALAVVLGLASQHWWVTEVFAIGDALQVWP